MSQFPKVTEGDIGARICHDTGGFMKTENVKNQVLNDQSKYVTKEKCGQEMVEQFAAFNKQNSFETQRNTPSYTKVDVSKIKAISGIGPIVSKHSINRYSIDDWREHNEKALDSSVISDSNILNYNVQTAINTGIGNMDQAQHMNNNLLENKAKDLFKWKVEVELACKAIATEVELLEVARQRIKDAIKALLLPAAISKECIELRSIRAEPDLVSDIADQELEKERVLIAESKQHLKDLLQNTEEQLTTAKAAKHRIEYEWCDKTIAYENEANNLKLDIHSNTIMFKPGAVKFSENTAPLCYWEYYCRDNVKNVEAVRQNCEDLRRSLAPTLINHGKKLRTQADKTDIAFIETVALTRDVEQKLESQLKEVLHALADVDLMIKNLQETILKSDRAMKLAQTRLENRNIGRPHAENVRDQPHMGLIKEVKVIHGAAASLLAQLKNAEMTSKSLIATRVQLEKEIAAKRKSLNIDRERCGLVRSHYPNATELSGL